MIPIANRLHPFSHRPNTCCLIPGTVYLVQACPAFIRIKELSGEIVKEFPIEIEGPLKLFTVMQDLERGCVTIFSEKYRFHILPSLEVLQRKNPGLPPIENKERLSLGSHKKQDWEQMVKRKDFKEIFPIWFRLGSLLDLPKRKSEDIGMFSLLADCKKAVVSNCPETIVPAFNKLFLAGFGHFFVPRLIDEDYQGILPPETPIGEDSALYLLSEGAELIRSLFIHSDQDKIFILPHLPPEFFAGRMQKLSCASLGTLDLEWSKKTIRRIHFHAQFTGKIFFQFKSSLRSFRLRENVGEKGIRLACTDCVEIKSNTHYLLDQFQK